MGFLKLTSLTRFSICISLLGSEQCIGQSIPIVAPQITFADENSVEILSGSAQFMIKEGKIGQDELGMDFTEYFLKNGVVNSISGSLERINDLGQVHINVGYGLESTTFVADPNAPGNYKFVNGTFGILTESADKRYYSYIMSDGTGLTYTIPSTVSSPAQPFCTSSQVSSSPDCVLLLTRSSRPNGVQVDFEWDASGNFVRLKGAENNVGYRIDFTYGAAGAPTSYSQFGDWWKRSTVNLYNKSQSLNPLLQAVPATYSGQSGIIGNAASRLPPESNITTFDGKKWNIKGDFPGVTSVKKPGMTVDSPTYTYSNFVNPYTPGGYDRRVSSVDDGGRHTSYYSAVNGLEMYTETTDASGAKSRLYFYSYTDSIFQPIIPFKKQDQNQSVTAYEWTFGSKLSKITYPLLNNDIYEYDTRTNITRVTHKPKPGTGLSDTTETAVFAASCTNTLTCNRPTSYTDKNGKVTVYEYSAEHGGVLTETLPSDSSGIHPVKRYRYAQRYAWILNSSGGYIRAAKPVWLRTEERTCRSTATVNDGCQGGNSDEIVTSYDYGPDSGPNNLFLRGQVISADGQVLRTCYRYDKYGNRISEASPRAGGASCS